MAIMANVLTASITSLVMAVILGNYHPMDRLSIGILSSQILEGLNFCFSFVVAQ